MIAPHHGSSRTTSAKHASAPLRVKYGIAGECCEVGPTAYRKNGMMAATRTKAEPEEAGDMEPALVSLVVSTVVSAGSMRLLLRVLPTMPRPVCPGFR